MNPTQRRTSPQQHNARARRENPKKRGKTHSPKGSSTTAKVGGSIRLTEPSSRMSAVLAPCAMLGSWATSLLGRTITVVTPPLSMAIAHATVLGNQPYGQAENASVFDEASLSTQGFMDCDYPHFVIALAAMAGYSLSSFVGRGLQKASQALNDYTTKESCSKYMDPPHHLELTLRRIKIPTERFITQTINNMINERVKSCIIEKYDELKTKIEHEDTHEFHLSLKKVHTECYKALTNMISKDTFSKTFNEIAKDFLEKCAPPSDHFLNFFDCLSTEEKNALMHAAELEGVSVEALAKYQYLFIYKTFKENRDKIARLMINSSKIHHNRMIKMLDGWYKTKITNHQSELKSKRLTALPITSAEQSQKSEKAPQESLSVEEKTERILAFEHAYKRLTSANMDIKEWNSHKQTIRSIIKDSELLKDIMRLYGKSKVDEAVVLTDKYTLLHD